MGKYEGEGKRLLIEGFKENDYRTLLIDLLLCYWIDADMVCVKLPSPLEMSDLRAEKLMCSKTKTFDSLPEATQDLKKAFLTCSSTEEAPVIAFISKMMMVNHSEIHMINNNKHDGLMTNLACVIVRLIMIDINVDKSAGLYSIDICCCDYIQIICNLISICNRSLLLIIRIIQMFHYNCR